MNPEQDFVSPSSSHILTAMLESGVLEHAVEEGEGLTIASPSDQSKAHLDQDDNTSSHSASSTNRQHSTSLCQRLCNRHCDSERVMTSPVSEIKKPREMKRKRRDKGSSSTNTKLSDEEECAMSKENKRKKRTSCPLSLSKDICFKHKGVHIIILNSNDE